MATTSKSTPVHKRGDNFTPATTLNAEMLKRHKLKAGSTQDSAQRYVAFRNDKTVKRFARMFSTYRLLSHGVTTNHRLAAPLRSMAHYFAIPMAKAERETAPVQVSNPAV